VLGNIKKSNNQFLKTSSKSECPGWEPSSVVQHLPHNVEGVGSISNMTTTKKGK
jgi:hypothetical protein